MNDAVSKVSFCITCKGRLHHLRQTLPKNIEDNRGLNGIEFVLLDYSSPDSLSEWVRTSCVKELETGLLVYYKLENQTRFNHAHAKNVAHRLARGHIVCNLDADNFSGCGFAEFLHKTIGYRDNSFVCAVGVRGAYGRLAFVKSDFERLGGYNEDLIYGYGYEDDDLRFRAKALGLNAEVLRPPSPYLRLLLHDDSERTLFSPCANKSHSWRFHREISDRNIANGILTANLERSWGSARVQKNFCEIVEL